MKMKIIQCQTLLNIRRRLLAELVKQSVQRFRINNSNYYTLNVSDGGQFETMRLITNVCKIEIQIEFSQHA